MTGFEEAKARRNWLEKLGAMIPGFRGYQDRELRRDVDRMQREHLSKELTRLKSAARGKARDYVDAGQIGVLHLFEKLDSRLDGLSQAVRFADYGASGIFDTVKIGEPELERLYEFDVGLLEDLREVEADLVAVPQPGQSAPADSKQALDRVVDRVTALRDKWAGRESVVAGVVRT